MAKKTLDDEKKTTAAGLMKYAREYALAAEIIDKESCRITQEPLVSPVPAYFLAFHAIELTLKAYYLEKGATLDQLHSCGHDIKKCIELAKEKEPKDIFSFSEEEQATIDQISQLNKNMALRYFRREVKDYPLWSKVGPLMLKIYNTVSKEIFDAIKIDDIDYPDTNLGDDPLEFKQTI